VIDALPHDRCARRAQVSLALTESEHRRLSEIGDAVRREDPHLARLLSKPANCRWRLTTAAMALFATSVATEIVGAVERQPLVCVIAWTGLAVGTILYLFRNGDHLLGKHD
jgi:Protein of unknown function (DUF3040)